MAGADIPTESLGRLVWVEVSRLLRGFFAIAVALTALVLVLRVIPFSDGLALAAMLLVVAGAFGVGVFVSLHWKRQLFAFLLSCTVVPGYVFLVNQLVPRAPHALDDLAYVFGTFYGAIAGIVGVVISFFIARAKANDT
jgi:hypothetical protein